MCHIRDTANSHLGRRTNLELPWDNSAISGSTNNAGLVNQQIGLEDIRRFLQRRPAGRPVYEFTDAGPSSR